MLASPTPRPAPAWRRGPHPSSEVFQMKPDTSNGAVMPPLVLTIPETTRVLSTSRSAIYRYLKAGRLRAIKVGTRTLIPMDSAREFIASCRSYEAP